MKFEITYRGPGGALKEDAIEAASRADALSSLKARGISPISLRGAKPGGPQSLAAADATGRVPPSRGRDGARPSNSPTRQLANSLTAIAALAAIAIGAWLYLSRCPAAPAADATERVPPSGTLPESGEPQSLAAPSLAPTRTPARATSASVEMGNSEVAASTNMVEVIEESDGDAHAVARNGTEQVIAWIFSCPIGSMPPLLPDLPENEMSGMAAILDEPNPVVEGDSEAVATAKEVVAAVKDELKKYLANGGSAKEFLKFYHGKLVEAHQQGLLAREEVSRMVKENPRLAVEFRDKVNRWLRENGVEGVDFTSREKRVLGVQDQ